MKKRLKPEKNTQKSFHEKEDKKNEEPRGEQEDEGLSQTLFHYHLLLFWSCQEAAWRELKVEIKWL